MQGSQPADEGSSSPSELARLVAEVLDPELSESSASPEVKIAAARMVLHEQYKGAFPHPANLREFNDVVTNGAERAFALTEKEQEHRHSCDTKLVDSQVAAQSSFDRDRRLLIIFAFIAIMTGAIGSITLIATGFPVGGGIFGGASLLAALGSVLMFRPRKRQVA